MFGRIGHLVVRRRRLVLALTVLFLLAAGTAGSGVFGRLGGGGFADPDAESTRAEEFLAQVGVPRPELVLLVEAADGTRVDDPEVAAAGTALTQELAGRPGVEAVDSYWSAEHQPALGTTDGDPPLRTTGSDPPLRTTEGDAALRSTEGDAALVLVDLAGGEEQVEAAAAAIAAEHAGDRGPLTVRVGGGYAIDEAIGEQLDTDLVRAELIAVPVTLLLLLLVFGGIVAASLPLAVAVVAVLGAVLALSGIARLTEVSVYSINLMTGLGFGLAIDYSLFILSRFREESAAGRPTGEAVVRTVQTAGRTVAFSALTVAVSLSALLVFPLSFLRSFAYAGIAVVLCAAAGALLTLPALLAVLGPRVGAGSPRCRRRTGRWTVSGRSAGRGPTAVPDPTAVPGPTAESAFWHRLASAVMRRPLPVATGVVLFLLLLGVPFLRVDPGLPSHQALPASSEARQVVEAIETGFAGNRTEEFGIALPGVDAGGADAGAVAAFAGQVGAVHGVTEVTTHAVPAGAWLSVVPSVVPRSAEGERLVEEIRALDPPFDFRVGGDAAELVDAKAAIGDRLPLALALIATTTAILLFAVFGSILVPVKAVLLNLLSLTATFGAMVWIFQDGHLSGILGFTATGQLDVSMPILMFCVAFGLSMDYEVFLLARIKEEYDRSGDNARAIAAGLATTGPLITSAAVLLAVSFAAFVVSGMSFLKLMGVGLTLAILVDATVVRGLLVPAVMRLAGRANWWAPAPLRRLHRSWHP
ncbi:MMPL family transporter [Micromonospora sp. WMMD1102]|uniref:MMPL family transporter n=1 Tax=Micromonospora sp. WMMD1102 TaxID=3016105 RepID=UPI002414FB84|nr:MMPL family transporter [Micromonospora sp. WMMD1102]MDG4787954.1 MMPL family transporter [Micromonospora sp. WMMD1102]